MNGKETDYEIADLVCSYDRGPAGFSASVSRSADQSGGIDDDDWDADGDSGSDGASLNAYEGLDASHWAAAGASAPSAAFNFVYTSAEANAYVTMSLD